EHDAQLRRMRERKAYVRDTELEEPAARALRPHARVIHGSGETDESLCRDSREERLFAGKVPVRSRFRDPRPPGHLAAAEVVRAALAYEGGGRVQELRGEVAGPRGAPLPRPRLRRGSSHRSASFRFSGLTGPH